MEPARLASSSSKQRATSPAGNFLGPRATGVPKLKKKRLPRCRGWFSATFSGTFFSGRTPTVILVGFWPVLGLGHLEKSRAWAENMKKQFSGARGPKMEKKRATLSRMVVRSFLRVYVLTERTPTGRKTRNKRILGHFGLGQPLALGEIPCPG